MKDTQEDQNAALRYRELTVDPASFRASLRGQPLVLTKREFEILTFMLASPPGRVFSRRELSGCGWDGSPGGREDSVYVHIFHIRRKIRERTGDAYIETVRGRGFRLK